MERSDQVIPYANALLFLIGLTKLGLDICTDIEDSNARQQLFSAQGMGMGVIVIETFTHVAEPVSGYGVIVVPRP